MHGYGPVAKTLLAADLLDGLHLWVNPQLAGVGELTDTLIEPGQNNKLQLSGVRTFNSGVVVLSYVNPNAK